MFDEAFLITQHFFGVGIFLGGHWSAVAVCAAEWVD
jgi:hypothetical protein